MTYNPDKHHRRSIRLQGYDYSQSGAYFITVCSFKKSNVFCDITDDIVYANTVGKIITDIWHEIPSKYPLVTCGAFVLMPNHIHGIIHIGMCDNFGVMEQGAIQEDTIQDGAIQEGAIQEDAIQEGAMNCAPTTLLHSPYTTPTLGQIIRAFKATCSRLCAKLSETHQPLWQRNYYEHIIRHENSYHKIVDYIATNPVRWSKDKYYVA